MRIVREKRHEPLPRKSYHTIVFLQAHLRRRGERCSTIALRRGYRERMTKGKRTENRILDAAELQFAQKGFTATSLRDIADAAGIQQPSLYKHFESKDALYRHVLQRALQPLSDVMEKALTQQMSLRDLTDQLIDVIAEHPNVSVLLIRSILSSELQRNDLGLDWVNKLVEYGGLITRATELPSHERRLPMQIVATFNLLFGYFWASPIIGALTGSDPLSPEMLTEHKEVISNFVAAMD